ncbi:MAG: hypothetical protein WAM73_12245 [Desulfobacterales bacterium]
MRVILLGVLAYLGLVILLRISDKRTLSSLSSMNMFDMVITVAFDSTLASTILPQNTSLKAGCILKAKRVLGESRSLDRRYDCCIIADHRQARV